MIECQACGTQNPSGAAYCSKCARKLDPATQQAVVEKRASYNETGVRWIGLAIAAFVLIVIIALIALFVFGGLI